MIVFSSLQQNLSFPTVPEIAEVLAIITIIFKYPFTQNGTGTPRMKILSLCGKGFSVDGTGPASHFCPCLTSNLWEVPLKSMGLLMCLKLTTRVSALLDWCRTNHWWAHGSEWVFENLRKFVAIDFGFKMGEDVLAICEFPCFQQLSCEGKFYHFGGGGGGKT